MKLHIVDAFHTIQGEGKNAGRRAFFIRMPFCNLSCAWCDTEFNKYKEWEPEALLEKAAEESHRLIVITGGEPTMHKHTPLVIQMFKRAGYEIAMESNGHFQVPEGIDFLTVSPKKQGNEAYFVHPKTWPFVDEFKYVVDEGFYWSTLERHNEEFKRGRKTLLSLSPEWGRFEQSAKEIIEYIKENPQWKISLQTHKFLKIP